MTTTILPFIARVEVFDKGRWVAEAQGSGAAWLRDRLVEARSVYPRVRLVAWWGERLDESVWL